LAKITNSTKLKKVSKEVAMQSIGNLLQEQHAEVLFRKQSMYSKTVLLTALAVLAKSLYVPFHYVVTNSFVTNAGYSFIFTPPASTIHFNSVNISPTVNTFQLLLEICIVVLIGYLIAHWAKSNANMYFSPKAIQWQKLTAQEKKDAIELLNAAQKNDKKITEESCDKHGINSNLKAFLID
jgi:K+-sensing histidine kinase KdpD